MVSTGINKDRIFAAIVKAGDELNFTVVMREKTKIQQQYNQRLVTMTEALLAGALEQDAEFSLKLERICVEFEKSQHGITPDELNRYNKQLSELASAKNSLQLISNSKNYKTHLNNNGVSYSRENIPKGEAYLNNANKQIQYLAQGKKGISMPIEKKFYAARQDNLRAGIKNFRELQHRALGFEE